ncbi:MAG TPA: outer membrane beta-barrel protein [Gemmatimonadaceae bacterium]|jgi:hypothetical protein
MKRTLGTVGIALLWLCVIATTSAAQAVKSKSSGFFVGAGLEGNGIVTNVSGNSSITENGSGAGLILGYGFSPRWAMYGGLSGAVINADGGGGYGLAHLDVGARVHFRTGPNIVVPFLQFGISARAEGQDITTSSGTHKVEAGGTGVAFGGGLNAHFTPAVAFSGSVVWSVGDFTDYKVDGSSVDGATVRATSARIHLGLIWFPGS